MKRLRNALLRAQTLQQFIEVLHGDDSDAVICGRLLPHGGPSTGAAIRQHRIRGQISSKMQAVYASAYRLNDEVRLHMQDLAGQAAGAPAISQAEAA